MADRPARIQLRRTKGWRLPPNARSVARPTKFGNPFRIADAIEAGFLSVDTPPEEAAKFVVECFRDWTAGDSDWWRGPESDERKAWMRRHLADLRGLDLACWCRLGHPCHADVLLELANA